MFVVDRRRTTSVVGTALVMAAFAAGCSGSGSLPTVLPPVSTTPAANSSTAPTQDPKAAALAVVKQYFRLLNNLPRDMDYQGIGALMTPACTCRAQVQAIKTARERGQHYVDHWRDLTTAPVVNGARSVDVLVQYDAGAGGLVDKSGHRVTYAPPKADVKRLFSLELVGNQWLIYRIATA